MSIEHNVNKEVNCSGMLCPMPIVLTTKAIKEVDIGEVIKVISTDAGSPPDMKAWARQTGHELLEYENDETVFTFYIRRVN